MNALNKYSIFQAVRHLTSDLLGYDAFLSSKGDLLRSQMIERAENVFEGSYRCFSWTDVFPFSQFNVEVS